MRHNRFWSLIAAAMVAGPAAVPLAAAWLIELGEGFTAQITLRYAFSFLARLVIGMGAVFELPILIFFLAWIGVVTPGFLIRHFRAAVLIIALFYTIVVLEGSGHIPLIFGAMVAALIAGVNLGMPWQDIPTCANISIYRFNRGMIGFCS